MVAQLSSKQYKSKAELLRCGACLSGSYTVSKWPLVGDCGATEKLETFSSCSLLIRNNEFLFTFSNSPSMY